MSVQYADNANGVVNENGAEEDLHTPESPYVVFPALILILIMPLAIVLHPSWLPTIAEIGALIMFGVIFKLMRQ